MLLDFGFLTVEAYFISLRVRTSKPLMKFRPVKFMRIKTDRQRIVLVDIFRIRIIQSARLIENV